MNEQIKSPTPTLVLVVPLPTQGSSLSSSFLVAEDYGTSKRKKEETGLSVQNINSNKDFHETELCKCSFSSGCLSNDN